MDDPIDNFDEALNNEFEVKLKLGFLRNQNHRDNVHFKMTKMSFLLLFNPSLKVTNSNYLLPVSSILEKNTWEKRSKHIFFIFI